MCPMCLAAGGVYVAGALSAGAVTTFLATTFFHKRPEPSAFTTSIESEGDDHAATADRIER